MKIIITTLFAITGLFFFTGSIDLDNLPNYANQAVPNYINNDNTPGNNDITDQGATLGRVLFYDKNLSANNTIACADCHKQEFAFSDPAVVSTGLNGELTGRHSMRLVNARFADEVRFFWDERAASLEAQTTQPIRDHVEMGFSGENGDPSFADLIEKLEDIEYYQQLFTEVYGDAEITENRMQLALAQFIRSIQSFDSKYDEGRAQVNNNNADFPNFTAQENLGKMLFSTGVNQGGANCQNCHRAPAFDIAPNRDNNGVIGVAGDPNAVDLTNTRSPSLRDLVNPDGESNGPFMHDGSLPTLLDVINHYDQIEVNDNLDNRLRGGRGGGGGGGGGQGQNLNLTDAEKDALVAFLRTLTGSAIYTDEKWSNPFDEVGNLTILNGPIAGSIDQDNDGFDLTVDCDDNNAAIHPNATEIPDNDIDENCDGIAAVTAIADNDNDGFNADEDCDDNNAAINPNATEIPDNDIDENCDGIAAVTAIADNDNDGFNADEDCDDNNAAINPNATEIPDNDIDENCDGIAAVTAIADNDNDGFNADEDCDDNNAAINPNATEIPDNDIDENCDGIAAVTAIADNDNDGFNADEDCDDNNAAINPNATEIPDNDIDENCDGIAAVTAIADNDNDGFNADEDCDDNNAAIHPDATDIPDNGIDEDCDGIDAMAAVEDGSCGTPTNITSNQIGRRRVAVSWQEVAGADAYRIQIRIAGQNRWLVTSTVTRTRVFISGPPNSYEYRIQTICGEDESEFSDVLPLMISRNFIEAESRSATEIADIDLMETIIDTEFRLYPNPVRNVLTVQYNIASAAQVQVHHLSGQLIYQATLVEGSLTNQIDVADFEEGIYLITVREEGQLPIVKKFIKQSTN